MKMKEFVRPQVLRLQLLVRSNFHFRSDHNQVVHLRDTSKKKQLEDSKKHQVQLQDVLL
jgi:hypothetical protein